jgi:hypothetical protein
MKEELYWSCDRCSLSEKEKEKCREHPGICGEGVLRERGTPSDTRR